MKRAIGIATVLALATLASPADAQLATFDDLAECVPTNYYGTPIGNGYAGLNWTNLYIVDGAAALAQYPTGVGYGHGIVSGHCAAINAGGQMADISSTNPFTFEGGFFTAAYNDALSVAITGFSGSTQLFTTTIALHTTSQLQLNVNWAGVDRVHFQAVDGKANGHFVLDNMRFAMATDPSVVPEPATLLLVAGGLGLLALLGIRRRLTS